MSDDISTQLALLSEEELPVLAPAALVRQRGEQRRRRVRLAATTGVAAVVLAMGGLIASSLPGDHDDSLRVAKNPPPSATPEPTHATTPENGTRGLPLALLSAEDIRTLLGGDPQIADTHVEPPTEIVGCALPMSAANGSVGLLRRFSAGETSVFQEAVQLAAGADFLGQVARDFRACPDVPQDDNEGVKHYKEVGKGSATATAFTVRSDQCRQTCSPDAVLVMVQVGRAFSSLSLPLSALNRVEAAEALMRDRLARSSLVTEPAYPTPDVKSTEVWGVYLDVTDSPDAPEYSIVQDDASKAGLSPATGELGCDRGAPEALGRSATASRVTVYFSTQSDAELFVRSWHRPVVGIAQVELGCND